MPRCSTLTMQSLPLGHAPALAAFGGQVAALRDRAMGGYIEQQVDYFKFTRILEFSRVSLPSVFEQLRVCPVEYGVCGVCSLWRARPLQLRCLHAKPPHAQVPACSPALPRLAILQPLP